MKNYKIIGTLRVRNEESIITDTIEHLSEFCDKIYIYDDVSTDNTFNICLDHPKVTQVIQGKAWDLNRERAEFENRQDLYLEAIKDCSDNDWLVYIDADERIEFDWALLNNNIDAVRMRLFDFYITPEDKDSKYYERKYIGPEFRDILFAFRVGATLGYHKNDQRQCSLKRGSKIIQSGFVKHYGKAISVDEWEKTCDYYGNFFPKYSKKWLSRKGQAIHTLSDFNRPLILWDDRHDKAKIIKL
jgi:hypothetical protein